MITFYGASVTKQKTGYAVKLKSKLEEEVKIFGFGGMHLNNAGICYIDKVIDVQPEYCFVDWFSTDYIETNQSTLDYLDTIVEKFTRINCKLIFLFFPNTKHDNRLKFYLFCKEYLIAKEIAFCDLTDSLKPSPEILRDSVHTTEYGSEKYAEIIFRFFVQNRTSLKIANKTRRTQYCNISEKRINRIYTKNLKINGNGEVIGLLLTIGPHSGIIKITNNGNTLNNNTWDQWCYYNREHFNISFKLESNDAILEVKDDSFDTQSCSNTSINFQNQKKKIIVHSIFYNGNINVKNSFIYECKSSVLFLIWRFSTIKKRVTTIFKNALKRILH